METPHSVASRIKGKGPGCSLSYLAHGTAFVSRGLEQFDYAQIQQ